jgi:putative phosphoribosyl transferase
VNSGGISKPDSQKEISIRIPAGRAQLDGDFYHPSQTTGLVVFAHGSGSSRLSPRNRYVAKILRNAGLGTLLFDLLTPEEEFEDERTGVLRFDIRLLAQRLIQATDWLINNLETSDYQFGYFGASTGAAAALIAAAEIPQRIFAVVSRGGRPDLAGSALVRVKAPTLLIVGGNDSDVIQLNQAAYAALKTEKKLEIVSGATHLFEEPGTLDQVGKLASVWFSRYLLKINPIKKEP